MNTLKTFIRFALILIFLILLVILSITLFKLIPKGINQLANASLSLTGLTEERPSTTTVMVDRVAQPVATTTNGLNGVITQNTGDIIISDKKTYSAPATTRTIYKTVYYPTTPKLTGLKNIKVSLSTTGIIDRNSGQFITTNSFNTNDVVSVRYKITNDNDTDTGIFNMRVEMPAIAYEDRVKYINNLSLPAYSVYTVEARFDGINTTVNPTVRIYTDVENQVSESNENDNTLIVTLNNINNNYNYNNNCNYYNNYCNNNNNNYGTSPNLTISSIETGKMINNSFSPQTNFVYGDRIALRVRVRNNGGSFSNTWSTRTNFYDNMGTNRTIVTDNERPLNSGEETVLTIQTNDTVYRGTTVFNFNLDTNNNVYESNESDNSSSVSVYVY